MRTIGNLTSLEGKVCVYLESRTLGNLFLKNAEAEGFTFADGTKPTEKEWEPVIIVDKNWTLRYLVGMAAHMAFRNPKSVVGEPWIRIDYRKYLAGEENYFYEDEKEEEKDPFTDEFAVHELNEIGSGKAGDLHSGEACFLVKGKEVEDMYSPFWRWLREQGFHSWGRHGHFAYVDWVYINVRSKIYAPGMPGIGLASPLFNHAITLEEFYTIWNIYSKYEGLSMLQMK